MNSVTVLFCLCLALAVALISDATADNFGKENSGTKKQIGGLWFGPRLGRRKRLQTGANSNALATGNNNNNNNEDNYYRSTLLKKEQVEELLEKSLVESSALLVVGIVNEGKRPQQGLFNEPKPWDKNDMDAEYQTTNTNDNYVRY